MAELIHGRLYTEPSKYLRNTNRHIDERWFRYYYSLFRDRGNIELSSIGLLLSDTEKDLYSIKMKAWITYLRQKRDRIAQVNRTIATRPIPDALVADVTGGAV